MGGSAPDILYMLSDAVRSLRSNLATAIFTSLTIGFSLAIFSLFVLVFTNMNAALAMWGDKTEMVVYVKDHAPPPDELIKSVEKVDGVSSAVYVSREQAFEDLKKSMKGHESILEGVGPDTLPASLEVKLSGKHTDAAGLDAIAARLKALDWAGEVQYSKEWVEKFSSFLRFIELGALLIGVFLAAATVFIISNTIRLAVYARKDEIEILSLVGASVAYIKAPFFIEGVAQGVFGGVLASCIIVAARYVLEANIPQYFAFAVYLPFSTPVLLVVLVAAGVVMGVAGTLISMGRFLKA